MAMYGAGVCIDRLLVRDHNTQASFANYLILAYRLILLGAFFTDKPAFLWGGCMVVRPSVVSASF